MADKVDVTASIFDMTLHYIGTLNVTCEEDESNCGIEDCLYMRDTDVMVISDSYNKCIKSVNVTTGSIISRCVLPSQPFALTYVSANRIATSLPTTSTVQYIDINNGQLSISNDIKVNGNCGGLVCKGGELIAVTYRAPVKIEVLDLEGNLLHTVCGPDKHQDMFVLPGCVLFGKNEDSLIISDYEKNKVVKVDFEGNILSSYEHPDFVRPAGLTMTQDGTVLACSEDTHGLHAISADFNSSKVILTNDKNLVFPGIIAFSRSDNKIYINNNIECKRANNILIYQFY